jgi:hypothetical protein
MPIVLRNGERRVQQLLAGMRPRRQPGEYAFVVVPDGAALPAQALGSFREREGLSAILPLAVAEALAWPLALRAAWIVLEVHSSLQASGFTAAFASALGAAGIACNVVAAVHHDHLFVPVAQAEQALQVLLALQAEAAASLAGQ